VGEEREEIEKGERNRDEDRPMILIPKELII
jgi:hypothetical protein